MMINFSDCYVAKVKSFLGLKSIDPFIPFDEFIKNNYKHLKILIEKKQILVIDDEGAEVDILLFEKHIADYYKKTEADILLLEKQIEDFYENIDIEIDLSLSSAIEEQHEYDSKQVQDTLIEQQNEFDSKQVQKILERLKVIKTEEKAKIAHRDSLTKSLAECDEIYRKKLEEGLEHTVEKIEKLQRKRKSLMIRIQKLSKTQKIDQ